MKQIKIHAIYILLLIFTILYLNWQCENRIMKFAKIEMNLEKSSNDVVMEYLEKKYY